jgi:magnesium-dependent phosphatase 1
MDDDLKQFNEALTKMDDEVKQLIGSETTNEEVKPEVAEVKPEAEEVKPAFRLPRLLAFDLDGTLWYPDMYMLYDGGAPFQRYDIGDLRDIRGQAVKLLGKTREILHSLKTEDKWKDTTIAFVSCTDHPSWAQECLRLFTLEGGKTLKSVADIEEIYKADKKEHFKKLQEKTGIAFQDMIFFDNEMGNIRSVSGLGVLSVYTPDGLTQAVFNRALDDFNKPTV